MLCSRSFRNLDVNTRINLCSCTIPKSAFAVVIHLQCFCEDDEYLGYVATQWFSILPAMRNKMSFRETC